MPFVLAGPVWFLLTLFLTTLLFYVCEHFANGDETRLALCVGGIGLFGFALSKIFLPHMPWHLSVAPVALCFFFFEHFFFRKIRSFIERKLTQKDLSWILTVVFLPAGFGLELLNKTPSMNRNNYGNIPIFLASSLSSSLGQILIAIKFPANKVIDYVGKNSMLYMGIHEILIYTLRCFFVYKNDSLPGPLLLGTALYFALIPVCMLINRYLPFIMEKPSAPKMRRAEQNKP